MADRKAALSPLLERIRFYFDILEESSEAYYFVIDFSSGVTMLSKKMAEDFGIGNTVISDLVAVWLPLVHPEDLARVKQIDDDLRRGDGSKDRINVEYRCKDKHGDYVWMRVRGKLLRDKEGKPHFFGGILNPLDRLNQADVITGLLNKTHFEQAVKKALEEYAHTGIGGRIMLLGLDNFRTINESHNRYFGDAVLRMTARQLTNLLPTGAMLFKLDSDEFGIILPGARAAQVAQVFGAIQACMSRQQSIDGMPYFCTMSSGTVAYPEDGKEYYKLFKHAEAALVLAKRGGKNQNVVLTHEAYSRYIRTTAMRDTLKA
ncbi:MAG: sensor domain-containing diguanylate cyclase, partial [Schwartzia sp.]|nr:sensor domain-containing diguanylate cyclase [Schwartzia sp. (in: firmicutes)]